MVLSWFKRGAGRPSLPTVSFDASRVTEVVRADLWARISEFEDLPLGKEKAIYQAAVKSVQHGRDLASLTSALIDLNVPKNRAAYIARYLNNRATALMANQKQRELGLIEGEWSYAGAPCYAEHPASEADLIRDAGHRAAHGKRYPLSEGMRINGQLTFPGMEPGCKCISTALIPGFD